MDRQCNKKIVEGFRLWLLLLCLGFISAGILQIQERQFTQKQYQEMLIRHPEQELELKNSFAFYSAGKKNGYFLAALSYAAVTALITVGCCLAADKKRRQKNRIANENLECILGQLECFQGGEFHMKLSSKLQRYIPENEELTDRIWEKLRELGYYYEELRKKLSEEENSTKTLISDISHQLKTPLAALKMSHELLQGENLTDEERSEFFRGEEVEIGRLELLMQELVKLSRLENHMIQLVPEQSGIKKTITEAVNLIIMKAIKKQMELQLLIPEDVMVCHDSKWTVEAIANVLDNAVKYSEEGSRIQITVQVLPKLLLLSIEDEGIGIPSNELHRIYQRFYRGREAAKLSGDGAGIGLYLTRKIIEQQGGTITAKRKQQKGTIFRITLPL